MHRISSRGVPAMCAVAMRSFGTGFTDAAIAKAEGVSVANLKDMNPRTARWVGIDVVARDQLQALVATSKLSADVDLYQLILDGKRGTVTAEQMKKATDVKAVVTAYATILAPVREMRTRLNALELETFGLRDTVNRGLTAFKQSAIDDAKKRLATITAEMTDLKSQIAAISTANFTTALFNDLINLLRLSTPANPSAARAATLMMEDMAQLSVTFDETTQMLLRNIVFGDGPLEDSSLLFSFVEYPERGEISASKGSLAEIRDEALKTIAARHQTPLDDGRKLELGDTHPCLQRSAE
eukprot:TRINITY_DN1521_c0_g1_i4.p1 TRINITY_DN1521_c0_g1~~TRINITY_DN1521_c0_g1_i4.p1  ORF type:complete len:298 (-),score=99.67 TRINITY_DN1521_c0_g1_i4:223-1116(-)